jgi:hypothetical protein
MAGFCQHGNTPSGSIKRVEFLTSWATTSVPRSATVHRVRVIKCWLNSPVRQNSIRQTVQLLTWRPTHSPSFSQEDLQHAVHYSTTNWNSWQLMFKWRGASYSTDLPLPSCSFMQSEPPANLNEPQHTRTPNLYSSTLPYVSKKSRNPNRFKESIYENEWRCTVWNRDAVHSSELANLSTRNGKKSVYFVTVSNVRIMLCNTSFWRRRSALTCPKFETRGAFRYFSTVKSPKSSKTKNTVTQC